jgi:hypothetical protein
MAKRESLKILLMSVCLLTAATTAGFSQFFNASHVPTEAKVSFEIMYPNASEVIWSKQNEGYQVAFTVHHKPRFLLFNVTGGFLVEVSIIKKSALPRRIRQHLRETYGTFRLEDAVMLTNAKGIVRYETQIIHEAEEYNLVFNDSGYVLEVVPLHVAQAE